MPGAKPNLVIEVYFGHVGKHTARLIGSDARTSHLHDLMIIGGLVVCIAVMALVSRMARKAVMQVVAETEKAGAAGGGHRNDFHLITGHEAIHVGESAGDSSPPVNL